MIVAEETRREEMNKAVLANLSQHVVDLLKDECPCTVRGALEESRGVVLCCVSCLEYCVLLMRVQKTNT